MMKDKPLCEGKACREAREILSDAKRRNHTRHSKVIPKRAYYCEVCGQWHLTSLPYYKTFNKGVNNDE